MRRVSRVECLGPELQHEAFGQREAAKHAQVEIDYTWPAQPVAPRRAEPDYVHGGEGLGIEEVLTRSDASQVFDRGLDLVRRLTVTGSVQCGAGGRYRKRPALIGGKDVIDLPAAKQPARRTGGGHFLTLTERQFVNGRDLEIMWNVVPGQRPVARELRRVIEHETGPAVVVRHVERFRVGVGALDGQPVRCPAIQGNLQSVVVRAYEAIPGECGRRAPEFGEEGASGITSAGRR